MVSENFKPIDSMIVMKRHTRNTAALDEVRAARAARANDRRGRGDNTTGTAAKAKERFGLQQETKAAMKPRLEEADVNRFGTFTSTDGKERAVKEVVKARKLIGVAKEPSQDKISEVFEKALKAYKKAGIAVEPLYKFGEQHGVERTERTNLKYSKKQVDIISDVQAEFEKIGIDARSLKGEDEDVPDVATAGGGTGLHEGAFDATAFLKFHQKLEPAEVPLPPRNQRLGRARANQKKAPVSINKTLYPDTFAVARARYRAARAQTTASRLPAAVEHPLKKLNKDSH